MKYYVTIEETVDQTFEVTANSAKEAMDFVEKKYKSAEFVLELGELTSKQICVEDECGSDKINWMEF